MHCSTDVHQLMYKDQFQASRWQEPRVCVPGSRFALFLPQPLNPCSWHLHPQVLEQKQASVGANTIMGTDHVYVIPGTTTATGGAGAAPEQGKKDKKK